MRLEHFHPAVASWFSQSFGSPSEPQETGWPAIRTGAHVLIAAPTGSGKTLAAFLWSIDRLVCQAAAGCLEDKTKVLYISPLKALANDIQKNLLEPLGQIVRVALDMGQELPEIRPLVRTGDTTQTERRRMAQRPPHILVTTPESLFILLTSDGGREMLRDVSTVIVDEIHALARDKRGSHLALSLERLEALTGRPIQRIGLSATQKPIEEVARFLGGADRKVEIVNIGHRRQMDLEVEVPRDELSAVASKEMWDEVYDRLAELIEHHRATLVFVNTRRHAERATHQLAERLGSENVATHHGSLAREVRLRTELRLKRGELKAVVATASLELGLDIGHVDLVCQLGSTRSISLALQRIGRSGHWKGAVPKGRIFATTRDEVIECAALVRSIRLGQLDRIVIPRAPLDILAQQIIAAAAAEEWHEDALYHTVKQAAPYADLAREDFDRIITMLSQGISTSQGRRGAFLHRDKVNKTVKGRRNARLAAVTSGGAIPENASFLVRMEPEDIVIGTVDEDFATESMRGDVFLLGNTSWRIRKIESGVVRVEDAHGAAPDIPFWLGEAPGRTAELSEALSDLRIRMAELALAPAGEAQPSTKPGSAHRGSLTDHAEDPVAWMMTECGLTRPAAEQAVEYVVAGTQALGAVPSQQCIIAERFFDEGGGMQLILHAPFGNRINKAWGLALRKRFCRSFNFELQAAANENGILISLSDQHSFPLEAVFSFVTTRTARDLLVQALFGTPLFPTRWRWDATRALAVPRFRGGRKVPPALQRMVSDDLLASVFPQQAACLENIQGDIEVPDHPLVEETLRDCLTEATDLDGLLKVLEGIETGRIKCLAVDTREPSPFTHEILNSPAYTFLDDAPLEERRARAVQTRRGLPQDGSDLAALDPDAIREVAEESWPVIRDAEELHDALLTLVVMTEQEAAAHPGFLEELVGRRRSCSFEHKGGQFWVAPERAWLVRRAYQSDDVHLTFDSASSSHPDPTLEWLRDVAWDRDKEVSSEDAVVELVRSRMDCSGPRTIVELAETLALDQTRIESALLGLEAQGQILRGSFRPGMRDLEWCNRRILARIHRLTLGRLRKQIEAVSTADYMRFLFRWQRVSPGSGVFDERGLGMVLTQLQGFEAPAVAWEQSILPLRVTDYDPSMLDSLCLSGQFTWGRISLPSSLENGNWGEDSARRVQVVPTRLAPITFFTRQEFRSFALWVREDLKDPDFRVEDHVSSKAQEVLAALQQVGACFVTELVEATGKLPMEVEQGLWELVTAGLVTSDGFDNLRSLIEPKRRLATPSFLKRRKKIPRGPGLGRWTLLRRNFGHFGDTKLNSSAAGSSGGNGSGIKNHIPEIPHAAPGVELFARQLLRRWGVVMRDLLARESLAPPWRELLRVYRTLEARGEIRGGRFVAGFTGEQFALPEAVEAMRAIRQAEASDEVIKISAADPLNMVGILVPGARIRPVPGVFIRFRNGLPVEEVATL